MTLAKSRWWGTLQAKHNFFNNKNHQEEKGKDGTRTYRLKRNKQFQQAGLYLDPNSKKPNLRKHFYNVVEQM